MIEATPQFDWYEGTIYEQAYDDVAFELGRKISPLFELKPARPAMNYHHATAITLFGRELVIISHGGNPGTHFKVTGQDAVQITPMIRELFTHEVSRVDVRLDYQSPTIFDNLASDLVSIAKSRNVSIGRVGDWDYEKKGRTLNIGSRRSEAFLRWYEKGIKEKQNPDWCRLELEVKPKSQKARQSAAQSTPQDLWGMSVWSQILAAHLMEYTPYMIEKEIWQRSDLEKRKASMFNQYGNTLVEIIEGSQSPEQFGIQLIAELQEHRRKKHDF